MQLSLGRHGLHLTAACLLVAGLLPSTGLAAAQWRGVWADCLHSGFKTAAEVDSLIQRAVEGRYNAVVAEVMAFQDNAAAGHGAYWNSAILPRATDTTPGFDPLGYLCQRAAAHGIEVHAWLVTYRACETWPPANNDLLAAHPEYLMVPTGGTDQSPIPTIGGDYVLDPGSPDVQDYLVRIVRELVTGYPIKGINWDYIRYTQYDAGYPARSSYGNSSLKRFQRISGRSDTPAYTDTAWNDFRRRTIDELVRRCRAEIPSIRGNVSQPVLQTCDVFATGSAPTDFASSQAYKYFQNWKYWAESGWVDAVVPMNYKREHCSSEAAMYRSWVDAAMNWRGQRYVYMGQANYLNSFANSVTQMNYVFSKGCQGASNYSYYATRATETLCDDLDPWTADWTWYTHVAGNLYTAAATPPTLPWRSPATATEGTIWGQVLNFATGQPLDDATVQVYGKTAVKTDANGYYTVALINCTAAGTAYATGVTKTGLTSVVSYPAKAFAGEVARYDFSLGAPGGQIVFSPASLSHTIQQGTAPAPDTILVSAAAGKAPVNYIVTDSATWLEVSPFNGSSQGEQDPLTIGYGTAGLSAGTYSASISVTAPGATNSPQTIPVTLTVLPPPVPGDFDADRDVDQEDWGRFQTCLSGVGVAQSGTACAPALMDADTDVDETDVQLFMGCYTGPGVPGSATCAN